MYRIWNTRVCEDLRTVETNIFHTVPWVMPKEPEEIQRIFREHGRLVHFSQGKLLAHGGPAGNICLVTQGTVTFGYYDRQDHYQVFNLILPGRTIGDLESLDVSSFPIIARCIRPTTLLVVDRATWLAQLRASAATMEVYALSANRKHQCTMEGMICNYTLPLEERLRLLFYALITAHYSPKEEGWNPCPVALTVTEIAQVVACNRSWVSRTLSRWISGGLAKKDGRILLLSSRLLEGLALPFDTRESAARR